MHLRFLPSPLSLYLSCHRTEGDEVENFVDEVGRNREEKRLRLLRDVFGDLQDRSAWFEPLEHIESEQA